MRKPVLIFLSCVLFLGAAWAAAKPHVVTFGKWLPVKLFVGPSEDKSVDMKIRSLYVDGRLREFTTGEPHDITDTLFVVRKAFRLNDWLPEDEEKAATAPPGQRTAHRWTWQRGGWLLVNRDTGRISSLNLPDFDPFYSAASWYRDYVAYCGVSDNGEKLYAVVAQLGRKKPVLHKDLGPAHGGDMPDSECPAPVWQRQPARVLFAPIGGQKLTFAVRGHAAGLATEPEPVEEQPIRN